MSHLANKLIIFDCDGVLVDSEAIACKVEADFLTELGYEITAEGLIEKFLGKPKDEISAIVFSDHNVTLPANYPQLLHQRVMRKLVSEVSMTDGIGDILESIPNKCVASGAPLDRIDVNLSRSGLKPFFANKSIYTTDFVLNPKPAPDIHFYILEKEGFKASDAVVVEDSVTGIRSAVNAGINVIGYMGGSHCEISGYDRILREAGANMIAGNASELKNILNTPQGIWD